MGEAEFELSRLPFERAESSHGGTLSAHVKQYIVENDRLRTF